jgi:uncharacterized protein (DUF4415 family)
MKRIDTSKKLPPELATREGRAAVLAKAAPSTESEAAVNKRLANAVVLGPGTPEDVTRALKQAVAKRRTRGPNKNPTKVQLTIRIKRDTLERWKATGEGWQTRMAEKLETVG